MKHWFVPYFRNDDQPVVKMTLIKFFTRKKAQDLADFWSDISFVVETGVIEVVE